MTLEVGLLLGLVVALVLGVRVVRHRQFLQRMRDRGVPESRLRWATAAVVVALLVGVGLGFLRN